VDGGEDGGGMRKMRRKHGLESKCRDTCTHFRGGPEMAWGISDKMEMKMGDGWQPGLTCSMGLQCSSCPGDQVFGDYCGERRSRSHHHRSITKRRRRELMSEELEPAITI
jgi:hypothetical protein